MRGPHDERILASQAEKDEQVLAALSSQRTPGGKALVRLVHLLEARGYEHLDLRRQRHAVAAGGELKAKQPPRKTRNRAILKPSRTSPASTSPPSTKPVPPSPHSRNGVH
jgi:hypothetical protein